MGQRTGWRALAPRPVEDTRLENISKDNLFRAARDAATALGLRPSARALLSQLVTFFGELIDGRAIVWPSNDVLVERTGLSERQVRYSIREMIVAGVLTSKDSANGKRYARRSVSGQIIDAFGLDLTPLLDRWEEMKVLLERKRSEKAAEKHLREEVTITRRTCEEALSELPSQSVIRESTISRMKALQGRAAAETIETWRAIKAELLKELYSTGNGGNDCRHKETNNDTPDQSCNNGFENGAGEIDVGALMSACSGAGSYALKPIRTTAELVEGASQIRGAIGTHRSAWDEACRLLGMVRAAAAVMIVAEIYERDVSSGANRIRNAGGYFRAFVRMTLEGRISLDDEVRKLNRVRR